MLAFVFSVAVLVAGDAAQSTPAETPAAAAPATAETKSPPAAAVQDPQDRVVCKKEHVPGSNRPQKICMTVREWENGGAEGEKTKKK